MNATKEVLLWVFFILYAVIDVVAILWARNAANIMSSRNISWFERDWRNRPEETWRAAVAHWFTAKAIYMVLMAGVLVFTVVHPTHDVATELAEVSLLVLAMVYYSIAHTWAFWVWLHLPEYDTSGTRLAIGGGNAVRDGQARIDGVPVAGSDPVDGGTPSVAAGTGPGAGHGDDPLAG